MRTISIRLADMPKITLNIGFVGENVHTKVSIDCKKIFDDYPDAEHYIMVMPPVGEAYTVTSVKVGDNVEWDVGAADLTSEGNGQMQITFTDNGEVIKSYVAKTHVNESIIPGGGGGGGTTDYNDLDNKPQIGGVTLSGNKLPSAFGIHSVPAGGTVDQVLAKNSATDHDLKWVDQSEGVEIDDTAGEGDTDVVWSANKTWTETEELKEAIESQPEQKNSTKTGVDLDVSDENGNVLVRFEDGQISTKKFDSLKIADVKSFGAQGDGVSDDTEALESAMEYAYENKTPVRFSEGIYIIRRPLTLRSNMEIYGEGNAIIKTKATATTTLTAACAEGDETITVASVSGFQIGDPIAISYNATGDAAARHCSVGYITGISGNTITFESAYDSIKTGAVKAHEIGCYVSNACAIFRSWGMLYECKNVYIHNLTLNGNRQNNEWADWFAGCIHIDASDNSSVEGITYNKAQENPTFRDLTIINSHFDGISDQGNGGGTVENCKIDNPMWHGVHFGTGYRNANVLNNIIKNTQNGAGVFWCAGVTDIIVEGNRIIECNKGCSDYEYGSAGNKSIVNGNIFSNITSYVFDFSIGTAENQGTLVFTDNIIVSPNSYIGRFKNRNMVVFSSNVIDSLDDGISYLFDCTGSDNMAFVGNIAPDTQLTIISGSPTNVVNASNSWN